MSSFPSKKVDHTISSVSAVAGIVAKNHLISSASDKIIFASKIGAVLDAKFLNQLLKFEKIFGKGVVLNTF